MYRPTKLIDGNNEHSSNVGQVYAGFAQFVSAAEFQTPIQPLINNSKMTKSKAPGKVEVLTCSICNRAIEGRKQYHLHLVGRSHIKNVERLSAENLLGTTAKNMNPATKSFPSPIKAHDKNEVQQAEFSLLPNKHWLCNVCNVKCSEQKSLKAHIDGAKHKKKVRSKSSSTTLKSKAEIRTSALAEKVLDVKCELKPVIEGNDKLKAKCELKPTTEDNDKLKGCIGHEFMKTKRNKNGSIIYDCTLCGIPLNGFTSLQSHMEGRKHRQNYKSRVNGNIVVQPKSIKRTEMKQMKKQHKQQAKEEFWREKENHSESKKTKLAQASKTKLQKQLKRSDKYILTKYEMIGMDPNSLATLLWFCECCEIALKLVSDEFLSRDGYQHSEDSRRTLKGTMRVGILSNMQILKNDRNFRMVLLLSTKPTLSLLERIYRSFRHHLGVINRQHLGHPNEVETDFEVVMVPEKACLRIIVVDPFRFSVIISLTSHLVEQDCIVKDETDLLSMEPCIESLQQLRRADWFQARAKSLNDGLKILKILRHLRQEDEACSYISEWANELLIEKCSFIRGSTSSLSNILRCYFELLSSGLLFDGPGLQDPCESEPVDLFKDLTSQQKEDITCYAQECLRLMAFMRPDQFLSLQEVSRKRRRSSGTELPIQKKQKLEKLS